MMLNKKKISFFFKTKFVYRNNKLNVKGRLFFSNIKKYKFKFFLFLMILISNTLKKIQWL